MIELIYVLMPLAGAVLGAVHGYERYGLWGRIAGVPIGAIAGFLAFMTLVLLAAVFIWLGDRFS